MELKDMDAAVCVDTADEQTETRGAGEIDLYGELIAFAALSPEEQSRIVAHQAKASAQAKNTLAGNAEPQGLREPVLTQAPAEPVDRETEATEAETPPATIASYSPADRASTSPVSIESVEIETTVWVVESDSRPKDSNAYVEPTAVSAPVVEASRQSGPLSSFNLPPNIVYTGALSRGVCLACGAESGVDDLFCVTCGVFIDEIGSALPVDPTVCAECKQGITAFEIFCPWCGSVLPSA